MSVDLSFLNEPQEERSGNAVDLGFLTEEPVIPKKQSFSEKNPLSQLQGGLLQALIRTAEPRDIDQPNFQGGIYQLLKGTAEERGIGNFVQSLRDLATGQLMGKEFEAALSDPISLGISLAADRLGIKNNFPKASEILSRPEEGLSEKQILAKRQMENIGMLFMPDLLNAALGGITKEASAAALKSAPKIANKALRQVKALDEIIARASNEGERLAAQRAKARILNKYDPVTGLEKIATKKSESQANVFSDIWNKTKNWFKKEKNVDIDIDKLKPEEADKFLEFMQKEEKKPTMKAKEVPKVPVTEKPTVDLSSLKEPKTPNIYVPIDETPSLKAKLQTAEEKIITKYVSKDAYEKEYKNYGFEGQKRFFDKYEKEFKNITAADENALDNPSLDNLARWERDLKSFRTAYFSGNESPYDVVVDIRPSLITHKTPHDINLIREAFRFLESEGFTKKDIKQAVATVLKEDLSPNDFQFVLEQLNKPLEKTATVGKLTSNELKTPKATTEVKAEKPKAPAKTVEPIKATPPKEKTIVKKTYSSLTPQKRLERHAEYKMHDSGSDSFASSIDKWSSVLGFDLNQYIEDVIAGRAKSPDKTTTIDLINKRPQTYKNLKSAYPEEFKKLQTSTYRLMKKWNIGLDELNENTIKELELSKSDFGTTIGQTQETSPAQEKKSLVKEPEAPIKTVEPTKPAAPPAPPPPKKPTTPKEPPPPPGKPLKEAVSIGEEGKTTEPKTTASQLYTDIVDRFHPLKKYTEKFGASDLPASKDPYKLARLYQGYTGKVETFLGYKTFNPTSLKFTGRGLAEIIKPYNEELPDFSRYLTAKRAIELAKAGKETGIDIADATAFVRQNANKFEKGAQEIQRYQKALLDYAEDSSLLSPELRKQWDEIYKNYVPMQRVINKGKETYFNSSLKPKSPFYRLEGSKKPIIDPLESIIGNTYQIIRASEQNRVLKALVNLGESKEGELLTGLSKKLDESNLTMGDIYDAFAQSNIFEDGKIKVFDKGKTKTYQVPKEVADAVSALRPESFGFLNKLISYPTRLLRTGAITLSPGTLLKLATIDQLEAFLYTDVGYIPYVDLAKGFFTALKKPELYWQWKAAGGDQALVKELTRSQKQMKLSKLAGKESLRDVVTSPDEIMRKIENLSRPLEEATRLGVFEKSLKQPGMTKDDLLNAALSARDATLDFARKGAKTRAATQSIPFFNAAIQGADKFFREAKGNPKMLLKALTAVTVPTLALYLVNRKNPKWQELPDWEKNGYWHFYVPMPGMDDIHFKIAKPFELGSVFANVPERLAEYADTKDPDNIKAILEGFWDVFTPSFTPAFATPFIETFANKKIFSGAPIIPERLLRKPKEEQFQPYTSESAKVLGRFLAKVPFVSNTKAASPLMLDHWINSFTAGAGSTAINLTENLLRKTGVIPEKIDPEKSFADYPILKQFFGQKGYTTQAKSIRQFYEEVDKLQAYKNAYTTARKEGRTKDAIKYRELSEPARLQRGVRLRKTFAKNFGAIRNILADDVHYTPKDKKVLIDKLTENLVNGARAYLGKSSIKLDEKHQKVDNQTD